MSENASPEPELEPRNDAGTGEGTGTIPSIHAEDAPEAFAGEEMKEDAAEEESGARLNELPGPSGPYLFREYAFPQQFREERIPHLGHLCFLSVLFFLGQLAAIVLFRVALSYHLFGVSTLHQAVEDIRYTLGSQGTAYLLTFAGALVFFPLLWRKGLFEGLHWRGATALSHTMRLLGAASACFVLAMIDGFLLPGPADAPIDKVFRSPGAAWTLFAFGISFAPFFEEIFFRGFLLPALCTAADWIREQASHRPAPTLDPNGHPQWSVPSMVIASIFTSVPFALMHAEQTAHAIGPFILLICVSLVLCWVRLATRSLASSVLVHACYNFLIFSLMLLGTGGFKHLEKL